MTTGLVFHSHGALPPRAGGGHIRAQRAKGVFQFQRFRIYSPPQCTIKRLGAPRDGLVDWLAWEERKGIPVLGFRVFILPHTTHLRRLFASSLNTRCNVQHRRSGRLNRHGSGTNFTFSQLSNCGGQGESSVLGGDACCLGVVVLFRFFCRLSLSSQFSLGSLVSSQGVRYVRMDG